MRRRAFITLLGGAAVWPLAARAQQRVPRVGVLLVAGAELMGPYREALRDLGYVEGNSIQIEVHSAQGQVERLPEFVADFVRDKVDIIVASQTPCIIAARNATRDIPIIMAPAGDPVVQGFVASLARPGGNLTGLDSAGGATAAKSLELVPELVPTARRVVALGNPDDPFVKVFFDHTGKGVPTARLDLHQMAVRSGDLDAAFAEMARLRTDAVVVQASLPVKLTADLAVKHRLPSFVTQKTAVQAGHLASYAASVAERGRQIAGYIDRILKGAKPADLPVQQPTRFEMAINLKTARAIGLDIPSTPLNRADEVIE
jgi:putative ABC transport system substrate-binding protein